jgi:small-conductance mechanosensitive channel
MTALLRLLAVVAVLAAASAATAQVGSLVPDPSVGEQSDTEQQQADPAAGLSGAELEQQAEALPPVFEDQAEWESLATRVEEALAAGRVSTQVLDDLRGQLATWRDRFLSRQTVNAERIATLRDQIAALGEPVPDEDPRVTARRGALTDRLQRLRAPGLLAQEAHERADGLITEIDTIIRDRQADTLRERVQSPVNPLGWAPTVTAMVDGFRLIRAETLTEWGNEIRRRAALEALPFSGLYLLAAVVLLTRGPHWAERLQGRVTTRSKRGRGVWRFLLSLGAVVLPFLGILALVRAIEILDLVGRRGALVLDSLPLAALMPILGHWMSRMLLFPTVAGTAPALEVDEDLRSPGARLIVAMGYVLALTLVLSAFMDATGFDAVPRGVVTFACGLALAAVLWRLARILRTTNAAPAAEAETDPDDADATEDTTPHSFRLVARRLLARALTALAALGVLAGLLGYVAALELLVVPAAISLFVLGLLVILQRLSVDLYTLLSGIEDGAQDALIPVLIGFALTLLSLPVLALVWGARRTDLTELLARAQEGFALGETRISPTDFLTFALVFAAAYTLTRLLQGALRSSILPRTKLDIGGRNAIVAGTGYVGIVLAAIVAITTAGIDLSGLAIVAGALSVGIGFGLQNIVSNFVSGIILLIERPISEGDWIQVGTEMGYVRDISVRSTRIETFDRTDVIIPNADLVSGQVTNWTRGNTVGRVIVPVGVAYGTDPRRVEQILLEVARAHPLVTANPAPAVLFQGFGDDSLQFEIRAILRDVNWVLFVKSDMNHQIARRFAEEGIEIPFPQRDLWLRNPDTLHGAAVSPAPDEPPAGAGRPAEPPLAPDVDPDAGEAG